jgi:hypothetical protein
MLLPLIVPLNESNPNGEQEPPSLPHLPLLPPI